MPVAALGRHPPATNSGNIGPLIGPGALAAKAPLSQLEALPVTLDSES